MSLYADKSVEVERLDNGWILTWNDSTKGRPLHQAVVFGEEPQTRGREIYTDEKKLMKRVRELI